MTMVFQIGKHTFIFGDEGDIDFDDSWEEFDEEDSDPPRKESWFETIIDLISMFFC